MKLIVTQKDIKVSSKESLFATNSEKVICIFEKTFDTYKNVFLRLLLYFDSYFEKYYKIESKECKILRLFNLSINSTYIMSYAKSDSLYVSKVKLTKDYDFTILNDKLTVFIKHKNEKNKYKNFQQYKSIVESLQKTLYLICKNKLCSSRKVLDEQETYSFVEQFTRLFDYN